MSSPPSFSTDTSLDDLDSSLREQVRNAVARVASLPQLESDTIDDPGVERIRDVNYLSEDRERSSDRGGGGGSYSLSALEDQRRQLEEELGRLTREVQLLEEEVEQRGRPMEMANDEQLWTTILSLSGGRGERAQERPEEGEVAAGDDSTIRSLKSRVALNAAFSSIQFESTNWEVMRKEPAVLHRKHTHVGSVKGFQFLVEFIVQEEKSEDSDPLGPPDKARIVGLRTEVDQRVQRPLQPFLVSVCRECNLMRFYQTYVKYCLLISEREEAFLKVKSMCGKDAKIEENGDGNRLQLFTQKGPTLFFTWSVVVSERGYIQQSLSVQVKTPSSVSDEVRASFSQLPELLQKMVTVGGHKEALLRVIPLVGQR